MKRLLCKIFGHRFVPLSYQEIKELFLKLGRPIAVKCERCERYFPQGDA
jgi:hypothetical protein